MPPTTTGRKQIDRDQPLMAPNRTTQESTITVTKCNHRMRVRGRRLTPDEARIHIAAKYNENDLWQPRQKPATSQRPHPSGALSDPGLPPYLTVREVLGLIVSGNPDALDQMDDRQTYDAAVGQATRTLFAACAEGRITATGLPGHWARLESIGNTHEDIPRSIFAHPQRTILDTNWVTFRQEGPIDEWFDFGGPDWGDVRFERAEIIDWLHPSSAAGAPSPDNTPQPEELPPFNSEAAEAILVALKVSRQLVTRPTEKEAIAIVARHFNSAPRNAVRAIIIKRWGPGVPGPKRKRKPAE
jgi:hypothetical protein